MLHSRTIVASLLLAAASHAGAQQTKSLPPKVMDPAEASALGGPKVSQTSRAPTLVERDATGKVTRLTQRPEEAAIGLLGLTQEAKAPIEAFFIKRAAAVSRLLADNTPLFLKLQAARQGGASRDELAPLMEEFETVAADLLESPLSDSVRSLLPASAREPFTKFVDEYNAAVLAEELASRTGRVVEGPRAMGPVASTRLEANMLLREMGRSLGTLVNERRERTAALIKAVDATPEQAEKIEKIFRSQTQGAQARTPETRGMIMRQILDLLTPDQRIKAREYLQR
ncbi:MAG: hypothetical protein NTV94_06070 [Planctomycetota bacterium]|nr:hypothetical protein [Planctomycetota bacterium]